MAKQSSTVVLATTLLLAGAMWSVLTFVPASGAGEAATRVPQQALRSGPATSVTGAASLTSPGLGFGALSSLGAAGLAAAGLAAWRRQRRVLAVPRCAAASYKDYNDPWLQGADLGFDPLNLAVGTGVFDSAPSAVPETTYYNYRESEVKHGRFAMTAFLAIFFEEADRGALLNQLGVAGAEDKLDGTLGLDEVQAPVLLLGIGAQALAEYNLQKSEDDGNFLSVEYKRDRCPGDLGFDPLSLGRGDAQPGSLAGKHNLEVNLGRLAMVGVTAFLVREFAIKG